MCAHPTQRAMDPGWVRVSSDVRRPAPPGRCAVAYARDAFMDEIHQLGDAVLTGAVWQRLDFSSP